MQTTFSAVMASDWRLAFLTNREKAFTKIYARTYPMVLHYVKQHQGTPEDAQDLLQEAVIIFYEKIMHEEFNLTAASSTYLMSICKNKWRQELEKRKRQQQLSAAREPEQEEASETETEYPTQKLISYVEQLGKKCQDILVSFYYAGYSMSQIAQQHQYRNVHTATVQKFKCLERLRNSLASFTIHHFR